MTLSERLGRLVRRKGPGAILAGAILFLTGATPAWATHHLMVIQEVFLGPPQDITKLAPTPDQRAQYVMLRMTAFGQQLVANDIIRVEDKDGNILGAFGHFVANVANGGTTTCAYPTCPAIIIGTQAAKNMFTFAFDTLADGQVGRVALPQAGGRVCHKSGSTTEIFDCVAWGNFSCTPANCPGGPNTLHVGDTAGNVCDTNFDGPAAGTGLQFGKSLARSTFNCASKVNSTQFGLAFPKPVDNAGSNNNTDADGDGLIDVLDCNDASNQIFWPAIEVQNQRVSRATLTTSNDSWDDQSGFAGPGVTYDEVRGTLSKVAGFTDAACHNANDSIASSPDPDMPPNGNGFYYLVRAGSGAGCVSTYGSGRDAALNPVCP